MENTAKKHFINGNDILKWFYLGAQEVQSNKNYLNSINVFPVADGDTGTNLSTTMKAMVERPSVERNFNAMMRGMSESGLAHARGNSGILFASYINGLAMEGKTFDEISVKDFACIAHRAVAYLYHTIENPVEGTIISVIKDWAAFLFQNRELYENFQELLTDAYQAAKTSLLNTTTQLDVLKKNHVVDSGADGFVKFLSGINRYFHGGEIEISTSWENTTLIVEDNQSDKFVYCTEAFLSLNKNTLSLQSSLLDRQLKTLLHDQGDSLIISRTGERLRVHIHTDVPEIVVDHLKDYGDFIEQKVDYMRLQQNIRTHQLGRIGILTDSIADLPEEYKLENQVHTLPLGLLLGESVYLDKLTIKLPQLFRSIPLLDSYPTSSQPEPARVSTFLDNLLEYYDSLIFIAVASKLSGTYQTLVQEARKLEYKGKTITILDSKLNSGAQGLLVTEAVQLAKSGESHKDIVAKLQATIEKTAIYVCLNTLEYAVRSGRVPNTIGKLGMKVGMRPIMTLDKEGKGTAFGVGFSKKGLTKKIYHLVKKAMKEGGIKAYSIVHADNLTLASEYQKELTKIIGKEPKFVSEISSVVAIHSGLGCVAVCLMKE